MLPQSPLIFGEEHPGDPATDKTDVVTLRGVAQVLFFDIAPGAMVSCRYSDVTPQCLDLAQHFSIARRRVVRRGRGMVPGCTWIRVERRARMDDHGQRRTDQLDQGPANASGGSACSGCSFLDARALRRELCQRFGLPNRALGQETLEFLLRLRAIAALKEGSPPVRCGNAASGDLPGCVGRLCRCRVARRAWIARGDPAGRTGAFLVGIAEARRLDAGDRPNAEEKGRSSHARRRACS